MCNIWKGGSLILGGNQGIKGVSKGPRSHAMQGNQITYVFADVTISGVLRCRPTGCGLGDHGTSRGNGGACEGPPVAIYW